MKHNLHRSFLILHLSSIVLLLLLLTTRHSPLAAATYRFSVPKMGLIVDVQKDASAAMDYEITFENDASADPIDVVDVGLPHRNYDFSTMTASIDGVSVTDIRKSEYVDIGVEVHLGGYAIQPGQTGVFKFHCVMPDMVYQDTTHKEWASFQITPTWFDGSLLTGTTDLQLAVSVPAGIKPDELRYQKEPYTDLVLYSGQANAIWRWPSARADGPHEVGLSFPKRAMDRVIQMTIFKLFLKWFEEHPTVQLWSGVVFFIAFGICFFRSTGGTGCSLFIPMLIFGAVSFSVSPRWHFFSWLGLIPLFLLLQWGMGKRKQKYLPAIASVEGGGIKRGLTAPEAAVLLEMPLNKVLTLVLFGLLKKGVVQKTHDDPLSLTVDPAYHSTADERHKAAADKGIVLNGYESPFLQILLGQPGKDVSHLNFTTALKGLIESVARKMKGFNLEETREYYKHIIRRAWSEAESLGNVELRQQKVDQTLDWLLLDPDYDDRFHTWERDGYHYRPSWGGSDWGGVPTSAPSGGTTGGTSLRDVTSSFAGWTEGVMGNVAGAVEPISLASGKGGFVDLSKLDGVAGNVLEAMASSSGSSGGGGGGCACAGCACACACAGGGR